MVIVKYIKNLSEVIQLFDEFRSTWPVSLLIFSKFKLEKAMNVSHSFSISTFSFQIKIVTN